MMGQLSENPTDFAGGVAVITGAGSGLGSGLADRAAARGMRVVLADINIDAATEQSEALNGTGRDTIAARVDVSDAADVETLAALAYDTWGRVDLLVNNAGVEAHGLAWEMAPEMWNRVLSVNLNGVYHGLRAFIPRMLDQQGRSHVVNVASVAALGIRPHTAPYGASKHACLALTEIVAMELQPITEDIIVSAVIPGAVSTDIFTNAVSSDQAGVGARDILDKRSLIAEHGMAPTDAAEIILEGASRGLLRIHTHPVTSRERIEARSRSLQDFTLTVA